MTRKNIFHAVSDAPPSRDSLVLVDMADIQLLLQERILAILPLGEMRASLDDFTCGSVEFEGELLPVFCVNRNLQLQTPVNPRCAALVILSAELQRFALACLGIEKHEGALPLFYPTPACMSSRKQPFNEFAVIDKKAVGLTSAAELLRVLRLRGATMNSHPSTERLGALQ